jgi:hypothetical protein
MCGRSCQQCEDEQSKGDPRDGEDLKSDAGKGEHEENRHRPFDAAASRDVP